MTKVLKQPEYIFAIFALVTGIIFSLLIPPIGVADENSHIRRISEISQGIWLEPSSYTEDKFSLWADNAWVKRKTYFNNRQVWELGEVKEIGTGQPTERRIEIEKNISSLNSPVIYLPVALGFYLTNNFSPEYWQQFYILRGITFLISIILIFVAIRRMPEHQALLAAFCLLPVMAYNRSGVNVDGIVTAIVLIYFAEFYRLYRGTGLITLRQKLVIGFLGLILAQAKGAYMPLLFILLLLQREKFISFRDRLITLTLLIFPPIILSGIWLAYANAEILSGITYFTVDNVAVWPDGQKAWVLQNPFAYITVILRTVFTTAFIPQTLMELVGYMEWNGFYVPPVFNITLIVLLFCIAAVEPALPLLQNIKHKLALLAICAVTITLIMTMLYIQWTGYQFPLIRGFQGRYLYPLIPALILFAKPCYSSQKNSILLLCLFGLISSFASIYTIWTVNY